jgi:hypothetical protein
MLKKNVNAIMEEAGNMLEWLTTGITYLLPQPADCKTVRNYRPITFLTTMYKALTRIVRRTKTYLEDQSLLPAGQN